MFKTKEVERMIEVELTKEELAEKSDEMSLAVVDRIRLKAKAKSAAEGFTAEIKLADQNIETLAILLQEKKEYRKIRCFEREAEGQIETVRADTGEIINVREMTLIERQGQFAFDDAADSTGDDQQLAESMANAAAFLPGGNIEEPGTGTPINTERMATEIDDWAKSVKNGQRIKRVNVDGNSYVIVGQNGTATQSVSEVQALPVLPISIAGENSKKRRFNCGTPRKADIWVEAGDAVVFTIKQTAKAAQIEDDQQLAESMANAAAFLPGGNIEEPGTGTPINTERMATEIDDWAKSVIKDGQRIKRVYVDGNPYVIVDQNGTPTQSVNEVYAVPVLPISIAGENSKKRSFNCGAPRKADIWIEAGDAVVFTIKQTAKAAQIEDDYTAPRCGECGRIEGAHAETCAHSSKFTYKTYLEFATAQKLKNPKSHARSMELKRDRDDEVRAWLATEQGVPADGNLFQKDPEPKPKRRGKLRLTTVETSYEEGA